MQRYTGVLYDALDVPSMTPAQRAGRTGGSPSGPRCSGWSAPGTRFPPTGCPPDLRCPGRPTLRTFWKPCADRRCWPGIDDLVVDLRSGPYAALAPIPGAVTVQVVSEHSDGSRAVVTTSTRRTRAGLARLLAPATAEPDGVLRLRTQLRRAGLPVEHDGGATLTLVVPAAP